MRSLPQRTQTRPRRNARALPCPEPPRARQRALAIAATVLATMTAPAVGESFGQRGRTQVATAREPPRAPPAPAPRVALQLTALRVSEGVRMRAMLHAIARDAWPQLVACAGASRARGVVRVSLTAEGRVMRVAELSGAPVARDPTLRQCVRDAVERIHPPAREVSELSASFELYFDLPAL